ncbi:MAG: transcription-repair coupling factor [Bacteroidales bacterium]
MKEWLEAYSRLPQWADLTSLAASAVKQVTIAGLTGSSRALAVAVWFSKSNANQLVVLPDAEEAAYFFNDLESIFEEREKPYHRKNVLYFPATSRRAGDRDHPDHTHILMRAETVKRLGTSRRKAIVVTWPEALAEMVVRKSYLVKNAYRLKTGEPDSLDCLIDWLQDQRFERVDFVYEPGQFSIRGGIVDIFSYTNDLPYRISFFGDDVESIRSFNPNDQLSVDQLDHISIVPNIQDRQLAEKRVSLLTFFSGGDTIWYDDYQFMLDRMEEAAVAGNEWLKNSAPDQPAGLLFAGKDEAEAALEKLKCFRYSVVHSSDAPGVVFHTSPQPAFNKNFDLLADDLRNHSKKGYTNYIISENQPQIRRLHAIFEDLSATSKKPVEVQTLNVTLHRGFVDHDLKRLCYTDHQIFERYHKYQVREKYSGRQALTIKELSDLRPGDYVTHIDHGVGRFDGLEKIEKNGKIQEAIRLVYKDGDLLYVSIHSLHRISKYSGKEGVTPSLHRLGSNAWNRLKEKTKNKVKDIARELIRLYAERKASEGFAYSPDTYLQHELEASFIYEDTPDQEKATRDVKADMEAPHPMDRLICGDVGFGKTEVAIRAAFKAVADSKQVAVLVPTTILALQHFKTFSERLSGMPCRVDYISRFRTAGEQKRIKQELSEGKIDILIGTHRLISKDVQFKDLGLLIIDEEQKFGVAAKEKIRKMKVNVDTLTLTATPIPRTLQFSLMGARDLSVINTPPPNRYPVETSVRTFGEEVIKNAIEYEIARGGQVFFVHNRVQNIHEVARMIRSFVPSVTIAVGHGQMEGRELEKVMVDFIEGRYDVLLATTIIESGLDIPNVNTIIINDAQNFGLSDLHQLRGRVGRSNRKAFCYLIAPPLSTLSDEARKRLRAIEEFSELGSGFNIAMRDLDIRGAGNILGAEQSGFITEIGFDMYQKILDEAVAELKESEFSQLYAGQKETVIPRECQIETDLALLIPDDYITNITERLSLYKELDNIEHEKELQAFRSKLTDRFGPVPPQTEELIEAIRLRWIARSLGFEKIVLKSEKLTGYFPSNQDSPFYQSETFSNVLRFVQMNPSMCRMKEGKNSLLLTFFKVRNVKDAIEVLGRIPVSN